MRTVIMAHREPLHLHLSAPTRRALLIALSVIAPYLIAAIGVFIYHGQ
jgi:hypothetical protein